MKHASPSCLLLTPLLASLCWGGIALAADEPESASDAKPKSTTISGVFEATVANELSPDTEHFDSFTIKRILPHGVEVKKGQNVVWLETEDVDKKLKEAETELRLSKLTLEDDEFNYRQFLETQKLDREAAQRARKNAKQAYDNFVQVDREHQKLTAEQNLKASTASLENAREELEQLEQMYKEDDLTEESEEIVLKRAKRAVEAAEFRLRGTEIQSSRAIEQTIPDQRLQQEDALARAELTYEKAMRDLNSARQRRDIEMGRKRDKFKDEEEKLAEMKAERKRSVLTAPDDGFFLHGKLNRGRLGDKPSTIEAGTKITAKQVVATIVHPKKLRVRVDLDEKNLSAVQVGATCAVTMKAFPDFKGTGVVKSVSKVPYAGTKYDCVVTLKKSKNQPPILPLTTCDLEFKSEDQGGDGDDAK